MGAVLTGVLLAAFAAFAVRRSLTYLHIFQQEEYDGPRFLHWLAGRRAFDVKASALLLVTGLAALPAGETLALAAWGVAAAGLLGLAWVEADPLKAAKKKLALTTRARRILYLALALLALLALAFALAGLPLPAWVLAVQAVPLALVAGNALLMPYENRVQKRFWTEAHQKLEQLAPTIIGITGSYGKTSVKHILGHVLHSHVPTLITPGSVNTPMGIARIVREQMTAAHRLFVCEMGAYGIGSVARLCDLAPPDIAVVTAVGAAHYERFKSLETVAQAKSELPSRALMKPDGFCIIAEQVLEFAPFRDLVAANRDRFTIVGSGPAADLTVGDITLDADGLAVAIRWQGRDRVLRVPLYGRHHGLNVALAFAVASRLGMDGDDIALALTSTPQVSHRLQVKKQAGGWLLIDDAYNSNPAGFASALNTLSLLRQGQGRRILVTPGMVELGAAHDEEHRRIGTLAATHVDVLLPVIPARITALVDAYRAGNPAGTVIPCDSFAQAQDWLGGNVAVGDVVLLENDLPDLYERKLKL